MPWVFVYGTLMRGMSNHYLIKDCIQQCLNARTSGKLYHLSYGYPMLIIKGYDTVYGEAVKVPENSSILGILDDLENYYGPGHPDNLYERVEKEVVLPDLAWKVNTILYKCPEKKEKEIEESEFLIKNGDWRNYIKKTGHSNDSA
ncbi:MAG: gamma-glutamylcyclotransferase [Clostridiales bacterium]|nr:gamma-glutamylcyclotransferase [Clostridiales bacterium]MCF8023776.1 gamma-glutamylcyclotransferase [Clostridiales bacterium]